MLKKHFMKLRSWWLGIVLVLVFGLIGRQLIANFVTNLAYLQLSHAVRNQGDPGTLESVDSLFNVASRLAPESKDAKIGTYIADVNRDQFENAQATLTALKTTPLTGIERDLIVYWTVQFSDRLSRSGRVAQAESLIRQLKGLESPGSVLLYLGDVYRVSGNAIQSEAVLRSVVQLDPAESAKAYLALGQLYYEQHRLTEATQAYQDAIKANPAVAYQAYWGMGMIGMLSDGPTAEKWFLRAAESTSATYQQFLAYLQIGHIYGTWCGDNCRYDLAEKYFQIALAEPGSSVSVEGLSQARDGLDRARQHLAEGIP
jgi:tetratricopeptide (TPR) repeat protein